MLLGAPGRKERNGRTGQDTAFSGANLAVAREPMGEPNSRAGWDAAGSGTALVVERELMAVPAQPQDEAEEKRLAGKNDKRDPLGCERAQSPHN